MVVDFFSSKNFTTDLSETPGRGSPYYRQLVYAALGIDNHFKSNIIQKMDTSMSDDDLLKNASTPLPSMYLTG